VADTVGMDMAETEMADAGAFRRKDRRGLSERDTDARSNASVRSSAEVGGWGGGKTARARVGIRSLADAGVPKVRSESGNEPHTCRINKSGNIFYYIIIFSVRKHVFSLFIFFPKGVEM